MDNIFTKIFKGQEAAKIGVNVKVEIDNETMIRLCICLLIVAIITILLTKLIK